MDIKDIKERYGLIDKDISKMFGYKSSMSFRNSTRRNHIRKGIERLHKVVSEYYESIIQELINQQENDNSCHGNHGSNGHADNLQD